VSDQPSTARQAFFVPDGDLLVPRPLARGPWGPTLHGRVFGALCAREVERHRAADPDLACVRLTVDIFRAGALAPVGIDTRVIRAGRRILVIEATISQDGAAIGQGKAVLLRRSEQPEGQLPRTPRWEVPTPLDGDPRLVASEDGPTAMWQSWTLAEDADAEGAARQFRLRHGLWMRELHDLVEGEDPTPLVRLAAAADVAHPVGNSSAAGLGFINADYTVYLGREPRGDYIGIQPDGHISEAGVGVAQCIGHDLDGPFGFIATAALANSMARANAGG
jgi:hypothetical protein